MVVYRPLFFALTSFNMVKSITPFDTETTYTTLSMLLSRKIAADKLSWLEEKLDALSDHFSEKEFYLTFSLVPRFIGKQSLGHLQHDSDDTSSLLTGFSPEGITADQAARILLLLKIPRDDISRYLHVLDNLFSTAEVNELVTLYSALPLLPHPRELIPRCSEGIRTNMRAVFDAVALCNPYPADYLDENAWNQMVLKAVFTERPLDRIIGLDARANSTLASMLIDYAHERWAAGRTVTPELWRVIGLFIDHTIIADIEQLFETGSQLDREAAALACSQSHFDQAGTLLLHYPELKSRIENRQISWRSVSNRWLDLAR